jgi:hypothetical protein
MYIIHAMDYMQGTLCTILFLACFRNFEKSAHSFLAQTIVRGACPDAALRRNPRRGRRALTVFGGWYGVELKKV